MHVILTLFTIMLVPILKIDEFDWMQLLERRLRLI